MRTASPSRFHRRRGIGLAGVLVAMSAAGALAGCQRADRVPADTPAPAVAGSPGAPDSSTAPVAAPPAAAPAAAPAISGGPDVSELFVTLEAVGKGETAADLLVTDPTGRSTGVEPVTFRGMREILHAWYDSSPPPTQTDEDAPARALPKQFELVTPAPGTYVIAVVGRVADAYTLIVQVVTPRGEKRETAVRGARIVAGDVHRFALTYDRGASGPIALSRQ